MNIAISAAFLANTFLCLLIAMHILTGAALRTVHTKVLGICYSLLTFQHLLGFIVFSFDMPNVVILRASLATLIGPIFFIYYLFVFRLYRPSWLHGLHCLPTFLVMGIFFEWLPTTYFGVSIVLQASFWGYFFATLYLLIRRRHDLNYLGSWLSVALRWLWVLCALLGIKALLDGMIEYELKLGQALRESIALMVTVYLFLIVNAVTVLLALQRHPFWEWLLESAVLKKQGAKQSSKGTQLTGETVQRVYADFLDGLENNQWFKAEHSFTIAMAAKAMGIPQRQLSEAINIATSQSYSQVMNQRRVKEAIDLMEVQPSISMTALMYDAGFRTKSSFNREFCKVTGKSPTAYREQLGTLVTQ